MSNYFFDAFPSTHERLVAEGPLSDKVEPGFLSGAGSLSMRGLAEVPRMIDLLGMAGPAAQDWLTGGTQAQDTYGREHDETFNAAVDYWTPDPASVHWSGQVVGGVVAGAAQLLVGGPALIAETQYAGVTEDLVRQGVSLAKANAIGLVSGGTALAGALAPFYGSTWTRKALSGLAANVPLGMAARGIPHMLLAQEHPELAAQYRALDPVGLSTDIAMALVFSGVAHGLSAPARRLSQMERDAVMVANEAKHIEIDTLPGVPLREDSVDLHVRAMRIAMGQLLRGEEIADVGEVFAERILPSRPDLNMTLLPKVGEIQTPEGQLNPETARLQLESTLSTPAGPVVRGDVLGSTPDVMDLFGINQPKRGLVWKVTSFEGDKVNVLRLGELPPGTKRATQFDAAVLQARLDAGDMVVNQRTPQSGIVRQGNIEMAPPIGGGVMGVAEIGFSDYFDLAPRINALAERMADMQELLKPYENLPKLPKQVARPRAEATLGTPVAPLGEGDLEVSAAQQRIASQGDVDLPTGYDADGNTVTTKASEQLKAEPDLPPTVFQAAITCFLGG